MGPPTNVDGEIETTGWRGTYAVLQWGRRQTSTERVDLATAREHVLDASMGPPTNVDGEALDPAREQQLSQLASMGPPTNVDGEGIRTRRLAARPHASMGPPTNVDGETIGTCGNLG